MIPALRTAFHPASTLPSTTLFHQLRAKLIIFTASGYNTNSKEFQSNDPDLAINGDDATFSSAIVVTGTWNPYPEPNYAGTAITLTPPGGPDNDGTYKDFADWEGAAAFNVKSLRHD